jgi:hypothetical protein
MQFENRLELPIKLLIIDLIFTIDSQNKECEFKSKLLTEPFFFIDPKNEKTKIS